MSDVEYSHNIWEDAPATEAPVEYSHNIWEDAPTQPQETYDDIGFWRESARVVGTAAEGLVNSFIQLPQDVAEMVGVDIDPEDRPDEIDFIDDPTTGVGQFAAGALQFLVPYMGVTKGLTMAAKLSKIKNVKTLEFLRKPATWKQGAMKGAAAGAVTDFIAFSPNDPNLSAIIQQHPELQNPITEFLATDSKDSGGYNRLRNTIEGLGLGILTDGIMRGLSHGVVPVVGKGVKLAGEQEVFGKKLGKVASDTSKVVDELIQKGVNAGLGSKRMVEYAISKGYTSDQAKVMLNAYEEFQLVKPDATELKNEIFGDNFLDLVKQPDGSEEWVRVGEGLSPIIKEALDLDKTHAGSFENFEIYLREKYRLNILKKNMELDAEVASFDNEIARLKNSREGLSGDARKAVTKEIDGIKSKKADTSKQIKRLSASKETDEELHTSLTETLNSIKNGAKGAEIDALQKRHTAFNNRMLQLYKTSGMINDEGIAKLVDEHVFLYRDIDFDKLAEQRKIGGSGAANNYIDTVRKARKDLSGRDDVADFGSTTENLVKGYTRMIDAALANKVKVAHVKLAKSMVSEDGTDHGKMWMQKWGRGVTELDDKGNVRKILKDDPRVQTIFVDGKAEKYFIKDKFLMESLSTLGPDATKLTNKYGAAYARGLKNLLTRGVTMNPSFFLYTNLVRDTIHTAIFGKSKLPPGINMARGTTGTTIGPAISRMRNVFSKAPEGVEEHLGAFHDDFDNYLRQGGGFGKHPFSSADEGWGEYEQYLAKMSVKESGDKAPLKYIGVTGKRGMKKFLDTADDVISRFEHGNRYNEYRSLINQGFSKRKAALGARKVSVDFAQHGSSGAVRNLMSWIPFANAQLQGISRSLEILGGKKLLGRSLTTAEAEHAQRAWTKLFQYSLVAGIGIPMYHETMGGRVQEVYHSIPDYVRRANMVIVIPNIDDPDNPHVFTLPKPHEAALGGGIFEEAIFNETDPDTRNILLEYATGFLGSMTRASEPSGYLPQGIKPLYEAFGSNEKYGGRAVVPEYLQAGDPETQYNQYTAAYAVDIGRKFGVSPLLVEHLVNGYFGTGGGLLAEGIGYLVGSRERIGLPKPPSRDTWFTKLIGSKVMKSADEYRMSRQEMRIREEAEETTAFTRRYNEVMTGLNTFSKEEFERLQKDKETMGKLVGSSLLTSTLSNIGNINSQIKLLTSMESDNFEQINMLTKQRQSLVKHIMDVYYGIRKDSTPMVTEEEN